MKRTTARNLINGTVATILICISLSIGIQIGDYDKATTADCPHCAKEIVILSDNTIYTPPKTEFITVQQGETLWTICREYCPDNMDIREYIDKIQRLNNISWQIYKGQKIKMLIIE